MDRGAMCLSLWVGRSISFLLYQLIGIFSATLSSPSSILYIQVHSAASAGRFSRGRIASLSHKYVDDIDSSMVLNPSISILEAMSLQLMCFCYMVITTSVTCFSEKIKVPKELDAKKHCHWNSCPLRTKLGTSDVLHVTFKGCAALS